MEGVPVIVAPSAELRRLSKPLDRRYALLRVAVGALALASWLDFQPLLALHFSSAGWYTSEVAGRGGDFSIGAPPLLTVEVIYWLTAVCLGSFCVGLRPQVSGAATFLGMSSLYFRNPLLFDADDEVLRSSVFLLSFARTSACWSVDAWFGARAHANPTWPMSLLRFKLAFLYLASGLEKLNGSTWTDGTGLSIALGNPAYARFALPALEPFLWSASVLLPYFEATLGLALMIPKTRRLAVVVGLGFQAALTTFLELRWFGWILAVHFIAFAECVDLPRASREHALT